MIPQFIAISQAQGAAATSQAVVMATAQKGGDAIVLFIGHTDNGFSATGVTDTSGNTYVLVNSTALAALGEQSCWIALGVKAAAAAANTVTVSYGANTANNIDLRAGIYRFLGQNNVLSLLTSAGTSGTTNPQQAVTTIQPFAAVISGCYVGGAVTAGGVLAGFTNRNVSVDKNGYCDDLVSKVGTYTGGYSDGPQNFICQTLAIRDPDVGLPKGRPDKLPLTKGPFRHFPQRQGYPESTVVATTLPSVPSDEWIGQYALAITLSLPSVDTSEVLMTGGLSRTLSALAVDSSEVIDVPAILPVYFPPSAGPDESVSAPTGQRNVTAVAVDSSEVLSAPNVTRAVALPSVDSGEAVSAPTILTTLTALSVGSSEVISDPSAASRGTPPGVESAEALSINVVNPRVSPPGIGSEEVADLLAMTARETAVGATSDEVLSALSVARTVVPPSVDSSEAVNANALTLQAKLAALGVTSSEILSAPATTTSGTPPAISSDEVLSSDAIAARIVPPAVSSDEVAAVLAMTAKETAVGVISEEVLSALSRTASGALVGVESSEVLSAPSTSATAAPPGVASNEVLSQQSATSRLAPPAAGPDEVLSVLAFLQGIVLAPPAVDTSEVLSIPRAVVMATAPSIATSEVIGSAATNPLAALPGITTDEVIGISLTLRSYTLAPVDTNERLSVLTAVMQVRGLGIGSDEEIGGPTEGPPPPTPGGWNLLTIGGADLEDDLFFERLEGDVAWELGQEEYAREVTFARFEKKILDSAKDEDKRRQFREMLQTFQAEHAEKIRLVKRTVTVAGVTYVIWRLLLWL